MGSLYPRRAEGRTDRRADRCYTRSDRRVEGRTDATHVPTGGQRDGPTLHTFRPEGRGADRQIGGTGGQRDGPTLHTFRPEKETCTTKFHVGPSHPVVKEKPRLLIRWDV